MNINQAVMYYCQIFFIWLVLLVDIFFEILYYESLVVITFISESLMTEFEITNSVFSNSMQKYPHSLQKYPS